MSRHFSFAFFVLFLTVLGHQSVLAKPELTGIAVINLKAEKGIEPSLASLMSDILRTELYNSKRFTVMNREDMDVILKEIAFQQSGACDETACIVQMGQALGVSKMVAGTIGIIGNNYVINAKLINVETFTNEILVTEYMLVKSDERPERVFRSIAWQLAGLKTLKLQTLSRGMDRRKKIGFYTTFGMGFAKITTLPNVTVSGVHNSVPYSITSDLERVYPDDEYAALGIKVFPMEWLLLDAAWTLLGVSPTLSVDIEGMDITNANMGFKTSGFDLSANWVKQLGGPFRLIAGLGINYVAVGEIVDNNTSEDTGPGTDIGGGAFVKIFSDSENESSSVIRPYVRVGGEIMIKKRFGISIFSDAYLTKYERIASGYFLLSDQFGGPIPGGRIDIEVGKIEMPRFAIDLAVSYYF